MEPCDVYTSVALGLIASTASLASPVSISSLLAAELERNPSGAQAAQVAKTLRQTLELEPESAEKTKARSTLHSFARALLGSSAESATPDHDELSLLVGLCDQELISQLLEETVECLQAALQHALRAHSTNDDAFATDTGPFLLKYVRVVVDSQSSELSNTDGKELSLETASRLLKFWKMVFSTETWKSYSADVLGPVLERLPAPLLAIAGLRRESLAISALSVMGHMLHTSSRFLTIGSSEMIWNAVKPLLSASVHIDAVLTVWLRWINASNPDVRPQVSMLQEEEYWSLIQISLATGFSERRKYAMYLLMNSMALVPTGQKIDTRSMRLQEGSTAKAKAAWSKYSTLLEITSLSTSPNQLRDAMPDIKRLLDATSPIPASWVVVLVALGFQSGSSSVQRSMWDFIVGLEDRRLTRLFGDVEGRRFLRDILLPYSSIASHYNVRISDTRECEYGTKFSNFLARLLKSLGDTTDECTMEILETIDTRADTLFAPARIYILKGLCNGLVDGKLFAQQSYLDRLVSIARMRRASRMKVDVAIAAVLRLMLRVDVKAVGLPEFLGYVAEVVYDKLYIPTEEYIQSLAQLCLSGMDREIVVQQLQDIIMGTVHISRVGSQCTSQNTAYKEVVALFTLAHIEGPDREKFFEGYRENHLLIGSAHALKIITLLASAHQVYPGVYNTVIGTIDNAFKPFSHYADTHCSLEYRTCFTDYIATFRDDSHVLERTQQNSKSNFGPLSKAWEAAWSYLTNRKWESATVDEWKQAAESAYISAEITRIANEVGHDLPGGEISTIAGMLGAVPLPVLGQNKHDNVEITSAFERYIASIFQLMVQAIHRTPPEEINPVIISTPMDAMPKLLRFMEYNSLLRAIDYITALAFYDKRVFGDYKDLAERIQQLWEIADVSNRADAAKVYHAFIGIVFHPATLERMNEDDELRVTITDIVTSLLQNAVGKRSIRPKMAKKLHEAHIDSPYAVAKSSWLVDIVLNLIEMPVATKDVDFYLEESVATIFDELMPIKRDTTSNNGSSAGNYEVISHYQEYNGDLELFSRVYACDMLNNMEHDNPEEGAFVREVRQRLFKPWTENYPGMPVYTTWKKASALQTLVLTESFIESENAVVFLDKLFDNCLAHEPHPRYRFQMEWMAALCFIRYPQLRDRLWTYTNSLAKTNSKLMVSLIKVGLMVARELQSSDREAFYTELVYTVLPLTSNSKATLRHQAIAMVLELWEDANRFGYTILTDNPLFSRLHAAVVDSPFYKEHADQMDFRTFNPVENLSFAGIFAGSYLRGGDEVEMIPPSMFEQTMYVRVSSPVPVFTKLQKEEFSKKLKSHAIVVPAGKVEYKASIEADIIAAASPAPLQTKAQSWDVSSLLRTDIRPTATNTGASVPGSKSADIHEVILVASLIDKPVNLGGLCRVSEIMGVSAITISDLSLTKKPEFSSTSVHSDAWIRMLEVPVSDIAGYLHRMRSDGYSVVGIEQTDESVILGKEGWKFPKKTVLVLGTERWGIPADLLVEMDLCVEIPQVGVTRSMNVQTAAAAVLFEWRRQVGI